MPNNVGSEGVFPLTHFVIHVVAFLSFTYAIYYDYFHVRIPREVHSIGSSFGGKFKFLTFWDAIIQAVYFGIALLSDLATINEKPSTKEPLIRRIRNYVFATFAFPLAMVCISTMHALPKIYLVY
ncbi:hypothetical protein PR048_032156 [Dryococelus australis]|uniref:Uncharacterized protein n=1 Tax=Dryococelus australis TaxID=614101 RepID=A0ABQ9G2A4_9NEOP|nr:hypothetical protein PR048_032156 [Dryococelus australis]